MPALARGQSSSCTNPEVDVYFRQNGILTNPYSLEFIIEDISDELSPVQVYPPTGRATVDVDNDCPTGDRLATGHFVAAFTAELTWAIDTHRVTWYFKATALSAEQSWSEDFEVLDELEASGDYGYTTVEAMRDEGVAEADATDARLRTLITLCSRRIDQLTGQWFEPRQLTITLDGEGTPNLLLHVPIVEVDSVSVEDQEIEAASYKVYNRHLTEQLQAPDDRLDPRIEYVSDYGQVDVYRRGASAVWPRGQRNITIVGTFGYTDPPGPPGDTPILIARACQLLVVRELTPIGDLAARHEALNISRITVEQTRDQKVQYGSSGSTQAVGYLTGDAEIDSILQNYLAPIHLGQPGGGVTD